MELDVHRPLLLAPGEGETVVDRSEKTLRILAELDDVIITWFRYAPGEKGPDAHVHHHHTDAGEHGYSAADIDLGAVEHSSGDKHGRGNQWPGERAAPRLVGACHEAAADVPVECEELAPCVARGALRACRSVLAAST